MGRPKKNPKRKVYSFRLDPAIIEPFKVKAREKYGSECGALEGLAKAFVTNNHKVVGLQPLHVHFDRIVERPRRYGKALGDRDMNVITRGSILECANNCVDPPFVEVFHVVRGRVFDVKTIIHLCEECFVKLKKEVNFVYPEYSSRKLESIIL